MADDVTGGNAGTRGKNMLLRHDGAKISIGGKNFCDVGAWVSWWCMIDTKCARHIHSCSIQNVQNTFMVA